MLWVAKWDVNKPRMPQTIELFELDSAKSQPGRFHIESLKFEQWTAQKQAAPNVSLFTVYPLDLQT